MDKIEEIVKSRHSVRDYTDKAIEGETLEELNKVIKECEDESSLKIKLVLNEEKAFGKFKLSNFSNCKNYIVIVGKKSDNTIDEKAGYYGEKVVIKAQELGLNTCWVGLTYKKSEIPFEIKEDEKIVIVIAIGYGIEQGYAHDGKKYEDVNKVGYSVIPSWYERGIEFALLAPTAMNQQRFKFKLINAHEVTLKTSGIGPYLKVDLGIVKYHFELGAGKENFTWSK